MSAIVLFLWSTATVIVAILAVALTEYVSKMLFSTQPLAVKVLIVVAHVTLLVIFVLISYSHIATAWHNL